MSSSNSRQWPELYIIGAPKCGTTALAHYLAEHPNISFCKPKEPHYFATDLTKQRSVGSAEEYLKLFPGNKAKPTIRAEGSVWYMYSREAVSNILSVHPGAKFVVMLRNPIDAAYALHNQKLKSLDEEVLDFGEAFRLQEKRRNGEAIPATCREPSTILYGNACKYGEQLERVFNLVAPTHVRVIVFEDFSQNTRHVYKDIIEFAGLADDGRKTFKRINESSRMRSAFLNRISRRPSALRQQLTRPIKKLLGVRRLGVSAAVRRMNTVSARQSPLSLELRNELALYFSEDVAKLSRLLGRDLTDWVSPNADARGGPAPKT